ncbi:helix-turn-helix domain-containing protein [Gluconobacter kondonii]|nr:helix-turn-helix domain-containing protein [Gluconobacter kondonii]
MRIRNQKSTWKKPKIRHKNSQSKVFRSLQLSKRQQKALRRMYDTGDYPISDLSELFSISRPNIYRTLSRADSTVLLGSL